MSEDASTSPPRQPSASASNELNVLGLSLLPPFLSVFVSSIASFATETASTATDGLVDSTLVCVDSTLGLTISPDEEVTTSGGVAAASGAC